MKYDLGGPRCPQDPAHGGLLLMRSGNLYCPHVKHVPATRSMHESGIPVPSPRASTGSPDRSDLGGHLDTGDPPPQFVSPRRAGAHHTGPLTLGL